MTASSDPSTPTSPGEPVQGQTGGMVPVSPRVLRSRALIDEHLARARAVANDPSLSPTERLQVVWYVGWLINPGGKARGRLFAFRDVRTGEPDYQVPYVAEILDDRAEAVRAAQAAGMSHQDVAEVVGVSRPAITQALGRAFVGRLSTRRP